MNKKTIQNLVNSLIGEIIGLTNQLQAMASEQREERILSAIADREEKIKKLKLLLKEE